MHIVGAFRFELSKLTVPAIRERMLASLVNNVRRHGRKNRGRTWHERARGDAAGAGEIHRPEVVTSPALSLTALPGDGGIRTRKVAILAADGVLWCFHRRRSGCADRRRRRRVHYRAPPWSG